MRLISKKGKGVVIALSVQEARWLAVLTDAARDMDPYLRMTDDHETQALYLKFKRLLSEIWVDDKQVRFSFEEFRDTYSIVLAANTLGMEDYFPALISQLPSDEELDAFDQQIDALFSETYPIAELERMALERRRRSE